MGLFDGLDNETNEHKIIRAPFGYPGSKSRSINQILEHLPYRDVYVEPFAGSGVVLMSRHKSKLEVFNDRYAGVVAFYRCLRDKLKMERLIEAIELSVHSREDFHWCKDTWENCEDDVERAFRWYYMTAYSFAQLGRSFGRATTSAGVLSGKIRNRIKHFAEIHERLKNVQIENLDWHDCIVQYDSPDTVFYLDPPYVDSYAGAYKHTMTFDDHRELLDTIFRLEGFVAVSGYSNPLYEERPWDRRYDWESFVSVKSLAYGEGNCKENLKGLEERGHAVEILWIKE